MVLHNILRFNLNKSRSLGTEVPLLIHVSWKHYATYMFPEKESKC